MALAAVLSSSCGGDAPARAEEPGAEPRTEAAGSRLVVAVIDFSGSLASHTRSGARTYLHEVVQGLDFGDRFVLLEMYRTGARDSVGRFVQDMPDAMQPDAITSYDRRRLDAAKRGVMNALPVFFDPRLVALAAQTDIFTTLHMASEYLRDAGERDKQLILLSDMLQSTRDGFEFEGVRRMPSDDWIEAQESAGRIPPLDGTCVVVIGADPTTSIGLRVRSFWIDWFDAAGASLTAANYRARPPVEAIGCD